MATDFPVEPIKNGRRRKYSRRIWVLAPLNEDQTAYTEMTTYDPTGAYFIWVEVEIKSPLPSLSEATDRNNDAPLQYSAGS